MKTGFHIERWFQRVAATCAVAAGALSLLAMLSWSFGAWKLLAFGDTYVPMAPTTALLILLLSAAMLSAVRRQPSQAAQKFQLCCGLAVIGLSALFWALSFLENVLPVDYWLSRTTETVAGVPVGRMSEFTVLTFFGAGLALLGHTEPLLHRPWARRLSQGMALAVLLVGLIVVAGYATGAPFLYGTMVKPMAFLTGASCLLLGIALIFIVSQNQEASVTPHWGRRSFAGLLVLLTAGIVTIGLLYLKAQQTDALVQAHSDLKSITDLKVQQLSRWRNERLDDASFLSNARFLDHDVMTFIGHPFSEEAKVSALNWLTELSKEFGYTAITLLDSHGNLLLSPDPTRSYSIPHMQELIAESVRRKGPVMGDLHRDDPDSTIRLEVAAPVFMPDSVTPLAIILLEIDPNTSLYPLVNSLPMPNKTSETMLVRRDGNDVLFLNNLRHQHNTALRLRRPLSEKGLPAARALLGEKDLFSSRDYLLGTPVLAAAQAVPGTAWFLVSQVDEAELYMPLRRKAWQAGIIAGMILLVGLLCLLAFWRQGRMKSLREQLENERQYRQLFEANSDALLVLDAGGRLLDANAVALKWYGYSREEFLTLNVLDLAAVDLREKVAERVSQSRNQPSQFEWRHRRKDGSELEVEITDQPITMAGHPCILANIRDITEKKRAADQARTLLNETERARAALLNILEDQRATEAVLRERDMKHRMILQTALDGFWHADSQGRLYEVNASYCSMSGYSEQELLTMNISDLEANEAPDKITARIQGIKAKGSARFESRHRRKDGSTFEVEISVQYRQDEDEMLIVFLRDITGQKLAEAESQKMDKLQSIGTLAGGIAHDFNNILLGLYGNISFAKENIPPDHPAYDSLDQAEQSMGRAVHLTTQLLTFAKGGDPVKELISLNDLIEEIVPFDLSGSAVRFVYQHDTDVWPTDADKGQMQQVISNLVINARQAMPSGGHLYINLKNAELLEHAVPGLAQGRYVTITVRDEGAGIEPALIKRIFDPYFTTRKTGQGLGLATVWSIIHKHGGHIDIVSELGKGTAFTLYLPASASPIPEPGENRPSVAKSSATMRPARILILDDDDTICGLVTEVLTHSGYGVVSAPDGQKAIELYRKALEAGEPFDAVIMDLTIPGGMGGKDAITALLALDPHVRVLVSSGYADDPVMANPVAYGFKGSVAKPYVVRKLREAVAAILK